MYTEMHLSAKKKKEKPERLPCDSSFWEMRHRGKSQPKRKQPLRK